MSLVQLLYPIRTQNISLFYSILSWTDYQYICGRSIMTERGEGDTEQHPFRCLGFLSLVIWTHFAGVIIF